MQFKLTFALSEPLTLPLSYHSALQGMIYHVLSDAPEFSAFLHDDGYTRNRRAYKLFVFGALEGPYRVRDGRITFPGPLSLEIRSPAADFCRVFADAIAKSGAVTIGERRLNVECEMRDVHLGADCVGVRMRSPLCLTRTIGDGAKKKTLFLSPEDRDFPTLLNENFRRKYQAAYGREPESDVTVGDIARLRKYVTQYRRGIYITAWYGEFSLRGAPDALDFLYQTGLGSRNSQGFGMFDEKR
ncbi:MAG: CRISPR-associated endoribonuclease Cas6 [Oscillibacter sp.]|nr:CRISPR-associated endoribonuclease Cas6 [Oscillibacter sp.]